MAVDIVVTGPARQMVLGVIAEQQVVQGIAGAVYGVGPGQEEIFEIVAEDEADRGVDAVRAARGRVFDDGVAVAVDNIAVIAETAVQGVAPGLTVEEVVTVEAPDAVIAAIAEQDIGKRVAGSAAVGRARQPQVIEIGAQGIAEAGIDDVGAFSGILDDHIVDVVDDIGIVARAADHQIRTRLAVEIIVAAKAL